MMNRKIVGPRQLRRFLRRRGDKRIVTTNGCFDILHKGHVTYLRNAKRLGDILVVAINTDKSVRKLKGKGRPVNTALDRAEVLAALGCVDFVTIFEDANPIRFVRFVKPAVHVKGADYGGEGVDKMVEYNAVKSVGGKLALLDFVDGVSTTNLIEKIKK